MADSSLINVQSVLFGANGPEVTFIEQHHITEHGVQIQTLQINARYFEEKIQDVVDAVAELIEAYQILDRNPPASIPSRKAVAGGI